MNAPITLYADARKGTRLQHPVWREQEEEIQLVMTELRFYLGMDYIESFVENLIEDFYIGPEWCTIREDCLANIEDALDGMDHRRMATVLNLIDIVKGLLRERWTVFTVVEVGAPRPT